MCRRVCCRSDCDREAAFWVVALWPEPDPDGKAGDTTGAYIDVGEADPVCAEHLVEYIAVGSSDRTGELDWMVTALDDGVMQPLAQALPHGVTYG